MRSLRLLVPAVLLALTLTLSLSLGQGTPADGASASTPAAPGDNSPGAAARAAFRVVCSPSVQALATAWTDLLRSKFTPEGGASGTSDLAATCTAKPAGDALAALRAGRADVAVLARSATRAEMLAAIDGQHQALVGTPVALDALVIIVHRRNRVGSGREELIRNLFSGKAAWDAIGGPDAPVALYGRPATSDTGEFFGRVVMGGVGLAERFKALESPEAVRRAVGSELGAVGFASAAASSQGVSVWRIDTVVEGSRQKIEPTAATVRGGSYPYTRKIYAYTLGRPTGTVIDFLAALATKEGQRLVIKAGFYTLTK